MLVNFAFSVSAFAAVSSAALLTFNNEAVAKTKTAYYPVYNTTVVTVTSCHAGKCTEAPQTTGVAVVTATVSGVKTEYTTYCPILKAASSGTAPPPATVLNSTSAGASSVHSIEHKSAAGANINNAAVGAVGAAAAAVAGIMMI